MKAKSKRKGNFPPLRFPEFKAEWKRKKLGEVAEIDNGLSGKTRDDFGRGKKYIQYKQIFEAGQINLNDCGLVNIEDNEKQNQVQYGDIFFTMSSETPQEIGMASVLLTKIENVFLNSFCLGFRLNSFDIITPLFARFLFRSKNVRDIIVKLAQGSTRYNMSKLELLKVLINIPDLNEQTKIASFLSFIDERISTQMKIIEEWEKFRYGLRFQLFKQFKNDSVKVKPTKNLINYEQPTKYIVSDNNYSQNPLSTPVLTANKAFILGYTNERFGIYDKGDCIIFDDFTMDMKYVTFPFKVKSSAIKILKPKSNINLRYVFEYLLSLNLKSGEHKRHYISEIASKTIPLLKRGQQNTIASLFLSLDYKIVIEKSLLSTYQEQKKYLLRNLFI